MAAHPRAVLCLALLLAGSGSATAQLPGGRGGGGSREEAARPRG